MSSLLINIGQCGSQIGLQLLEYFNYMNYYDLNYMQSEEDKTFHSIFIDSEPKIIKPIFDNRKRYFYINSKNTIFTQNGRGNNFALGYNSQSKYIKTHPNSEDQSKTLLNNKYFKENDEMLEIIGNSIRSEIEKMDYYMGNHFIYSLGGGTGSGFGCRITEEMKDDFNASFNFHTVVLPVFKGESPLQQFNVILSATHLQEHSDGIIFFLNEKIHTFLSTCQDKSGGVNVNLENINEFIASSLCNLIKLNDCKNVSRFYQDLLSEVCCMDDFKFTELMSSPFILNKKSDISPELSWEALISSTLGQVSPRLDNSVFASGNSHQQDEYKTISAVSVLKGCEIEKSLVKNNSIQSILAKKLKGSLKPVSWNEECTSNIEYIQEKHAAFVEKRSMVTLANRDYIACILKENLDSAFTKFKSKAYLHWYYINGMEESDFEDSFEAIRKVIDNYAGVRYL